MQEAGEKTKQKRGQLKATHTYVQFTIDSQDDLIAVQNWELENKVAAFDFPLEYEIIEVGEKKKNTSESFVPLYAAVPVEVKLPKVKIQKIDDLYLPKAEDIELHKIAFQQVGEKYDGFNDESQSLETRNTSLCGCSIPSNPSFPAGCVRVQRVELGAHEGVKLITVKVKNTWFTSDVVTTNSQGCWQVNKAYSGNMWMWVEFRNNNMKIRGAVNFPNQYTFSPLNIVEHSLSTLNAPFNNIHVSYSMNNCNSVSCRMFWTSAITLNNDFDYRQWASQNGVPQPRIGLNYLLTLDIENSGAAPMMQGISASSATQGISSVGINLLLGSFGLSGFIFDILASSAYPDVFINHNLNPSDFLSARLLDISFHELAHVSHYATAGESYWRPYRTHIYQNRNANPVAMRPYGSFNNFANNSDPNRVALGECFGFFNGWLAVDNFNIEMMGPRPNFRNDFIPTGLLRDLIDIDSQNPFGVGNWVFDPNINIGTQDNVRNFTISQLWNALNASTSIPSFRSRLQNLHLNQTTNTLQDFNNLMNTYDVFN